MRSFIYRVERKRQVLRRRVLSKSGVNLLAVAALLPILTAVFPLLAPFSLPLEIVLGMAVILLIVPVVTIPFSIIAL